jgi:putative ABC transport system substrate-binding protein
MFARIFEARERDDFERAFAAISAERPDAVLVFIDPLFTANATRIARSAPRTGCPCSAGREPFVQAGVVAAYGSDLTVIARRTGIYVQKILRGAKPGDLPIEQPTQFELIVNLRSAAALGLDVPAALVARANEVIR